VLSSIDGFSNYRGRLAEPTQMGALVPQFSPALQYRQRDAPTNDNLGHICVAEEATDLKSFLIAENVELSRLPAPGDTVKSDRTNPDLANPSPVAPSRRQAQRLPVNFEVRRPTNRRAPRGQSRQAIPRTADCYPACKSPRVNIHADHGIKFYSRQIAICANCRTAWEPIDAALIWDRTDPCASFSEPCDNCAFRPGSPEQTDSAK